MPSKASRLRLPLTDKLEAADAVAARIADVLAAPLPEITSDYHLAVMEPTHPTPETSDG